MTDWPMLIDAETLARRLKAGERPVIIDCQASLDDPPAGPRAWQESHIPGAVHAHLEEDLSGPKTETSGRHPLPNPATFARCMALWGITPESPVVVYDDTGGAFASRCWWLLRWMGQSSVSLLDGGLSAWKEQGGELETGEVNVTETNHFPLGSKMPTVNTEEVDEKRQLGAFRLIDARGVPRFRGEKEPIDPVAGHIPGAANRPFLDNLDDNGRWRSPDELRARFEPLLPDAGPEGVAHMCGSGVTACHNLFAMEYAGLKGSALYAGSWSEWVTDPKRPVATGEE